jgi:hypothetical protein
LFRPDPDLIWLFARNERELYAYWRLSERTKRMAELHAGKPWTSLPRKLRVYESDVQGAVLSVWETPAEPDGAVYVQGLRSGAVYVADIGYYGSEGEFVGLCRSEPIAAPGENWNGVPRHTESGTELRFIPFHDKRFSGYSLYPGIEKDGRRS